MKDYEYISIKADGVSCDWDTKEERAAGWTYIHQREREELGVSVRFRRGTAEDVRKLAIQAFAERYDVRGPYWLIPCEDITLEEFRRRWPPARDDES